MFKKKNIFQKRKVYTTVKNSTMRYQELICLEHSAYFKSKTYSLSTTSAVFQKVEKSMPLYYYITRCIFKENRC